MTEHDEPAGAATPPGRADPCPPAADPVLVRAQFGHGVATITMDSPHNRNALSSALIRQLLAALDEAARDDSVRVVVLSHSGTVFCSGADLTETAASYATGRLPAARMGDVLAAIWDCDKPVVARIGGAARAGGLGLIAAADLAVCADQATFACSEVRLGVVPAVISSTVLRRVSPRAAAELYLTGDVFDGVRAAQIGLVSAAVPADQLDATVARLTDSLVRGAPRALATAKRLSRRRPGESIHADLAELTDLSVAFFTSAEGREGVAAHAANRDPNWVPTT
jgi:methylglutaconyl-CoA hydratase